MPGLNLLRDLLLFVPLLSVLFIRFVGAVLLDLSARADTGSHHYLSANKPPGAILCEVGVTHETESHDACRGLYESLEQNCLSLCVCDTCVCVTRVCTCVVTRVCFRAVCQVHVSDYGDSLLYRVDRLPPVGKGVPMQIFRLARPKERSGKGSGRFGRDGWLERFGATVRRRDEVEGIQELSLRCCRNWRMAVGLNQEAGAAMLPNLACINCMFIWCHFAI